MKFWKDWLRPALFVFMALSLLRCFVGVPVFAQVSGATLSGTVADASGAQIANAKITIQNTATGVVRDVPTDSAGFYNATNLQAGNYEVIVTAPGFSSYKRTGLTLTVGAQQVLNIFLKVGELNQSVEVSSEALPIDLVSSSISAQIDATTVNELPLNGRDWTQLATLSPGVHAITTQQSVDSKSSRSRRGWGNQLTDDGHRPTENNFVVDGISVNDYSNAGPGSVLGVNLGIDGIQEFSVVTTNYSAEYGRTSGAFVNAITKSGTNALHGSAYGFFRNAALDAKPFFQLPGEAPAPFSRDQFGASAGYRLQKDKTFIFGDYEGVRQSLSNPNENIVLSANAKKGILADTTLPALSSCPAGTTLFVPGQSNVCVNNLVVPYLQFYPTPTVSTGDTGIYNVLGQSTTSENYWTAKFDHTFSEKDTLSSSYFFDFAPYVTTDSLDYTTIGTITHRQMFSLQETHVFSPTFTNTAHLGWSRVWAADQTPLTAINPLAKDTSYGATPGQSVPIIEIPNVTPMQSGFGASGETIKGWDSYQFYNDVSVIKGTHAMKFGFAFEHMQLNTSNGPFENGDFVFPSIKGFLTNNPLSVTLFDPSHNVGYGTRQSLFAGYAQDDWHVRRNLTVNLGVRYEATTLLTEAKNRFQLLRNFYGGLPVPVNSTSDTNPTLKDFAPRVGLAWDPFKDGKTSIRAGFGMFDVVPLPVIGSRLLGYPFSIQPSINLTNYPGTFAKGAAALLNFTGIDNTTTVNYYQPNPPRSYVMNWNMNVERDLGRNMSILVGYVGMRAVHQVVHPQDSNYVQGHLTSAGWLWPFSGTVNNPNVGQILSTIFSGNAFYNGLEGQFTKKMSHGIEGQVSYTWGHCIDDGSSGSISDQFANSLSTLFSMSPNIPADHRGNCDYDQRQGLSASFVWDLPSPKSGNAFTQRVLGDWEAGGMFTAQTGTPFTLLIGGDSLGMGSTDTHNYPSRLSTPDCKNPTNPGNLTQYIKLSCFTVPFAPASFGPQCTSAVTGTTGPVPNTVTCMNLLGNNGRNQLYGPGLWDLDFSLVKNNHIRSISEAFNIQIRAEFFNILNHPSFQSPLDNLVLFNPDGSSNPAGALDSTTSTQREIQFGVKLIW